MSRILFLDSGPLGLITHPQRSAEVIAVTEWLSSCLLSGNQIIVPAIICYELKRELLRAGRSLSIARLDAFIKATPGRYVPLSDEALRLAAELWAMARRQGQPTSDPTALDIDVILAAQAISFDAADGDLVVVTNNPKHLTPFIAAMTWNEIPP